MAATRYADVEDCVDHILERLGSDITIGTPLGIGKANHILNELVERAVENPEIDLEIWTALSLTSPTASSELEARLLEPLADRLFGSYPGLTYDRLVQRGDLPDNVEVHEFYFQPGKYMSNPEAQQHYHSVNYTHAVRTFLDAEPNLILQLLGKGDVDGRVHYNLGANTDTTNDLIDAVPALRESGDRDVLVVGQVNRNMPFMYGEAPIATDQFDVVLDHESYDFPLFGPPKESVSLVDHAIGLRVSTLIRDGGTLQIGIGSLGDSIASALRLRHQDNETYREIVDSLSVLEDSPDLVDEYGGLDRFERGLYGATEMLVEGFLHLFESGVVSREVYDDEYIQRLANQGYATDGIDAGALVRLAERDAISWDLDESDVEYLRAWGLLRNDVAYEDGSLDVDGRSVPADLSDDAALDEIADVALGESLTGGAVLDGAFFVGSSDFYERLREMPPEHRAKLRMRSVLHTNALYGEERLKRLQRTDARFVNAGMKATVTGGVVSDGTEDGRVVSGVGGQFNFVEQGQELDDGRSILMIRATRGDGDDVESNVVWNYGHITIPRHMRDVVVTEYGVADLRGKSDAEVIGEMIQIADSRFQEKLVERAKSAGKLPEDWTVPEQYRDNYPETIEARLEPYRNDGLPRFPFGTELTDVELALADALEGLQSTVENRDLGSVSLGDVLAALRVPPEATPYLQRMDLDDPSTKQEQRLRRIVAFALALEGVI